MAGKTLTDARIGALVLRNTAYDIRDGKLRGFGVRVMPSGRKRFFVHCQHRGQRVWKIVGHVGAIDVGEARSLAKAMLAAIRRGEAPPPRPEEALFEAVAETVFREHERVWKPRTLYVNRSYLRNQILPHFAGRPVADIDGRDVRNWFASLAATPVAADRSMPILSVIMREAERMGLRSEGSNPCRRHQALPTQRPGAIPLRRRDTQAVRGTVLTRRAAACSGCRRPPPAADGMPQERNPDAPLVRLPRGPPVPPRFQGRDPAPSGCRGPARAILDRLPRTGPWVFPALRAGGPRDPGWLDCFWQDVRAEAGLDDVRIHDLRHTHASIALRQGATVLAIARLLGHADPQTTLKYTHPADAMIADASETVGAALEG